jgi:AcrR family transcriptional regulator
LKQESNKKRLRRSPETVRSAALHAARTLLFRAGPEGITMPALAKELGMSHGNLTHHFGSVAALHRALVDQMSQELTTAVHGAVTRLRDAKADPVEVVDAVFRAFDEGGAGQLVSWLASTDNIDALEPMFVSIKKFVRELSRGSSTTGADRSSTVRQTALVLLCTALGNALIGAQLHEAVGLKPGTLNQVSAKDLASRARPGTRSRR